MIARPEMTVVGTPEGAAIMEVAILWLLCAAVFLELAESAPEID